MAPETHVVIVDDDDAYRELLTLALQEFVVVDRITDHGSARNAMAAMRGGFPAAMLLDLHMPELTGAQMTAQLREQGCPSWIVIVSAAISEPERDKCLAAGADAVVVKPNGFVELGRALQAALCGESGRRVRRHAP